MTISLRSYFSRELSVYFNKLEKGSVIEVSLKGGIAIYLFFKKSSHVFFFFNKIRFCIQTC